MVECSMEVAIGLAIEVRGLVQTITEKISVILSLRIYSLSNVMS